MHRVSHPGWRPICFSPPSCLSRPQRRTTVQTEQWSVYLIYLTLAHPVCSRYVAVWWNLVLQACHCYYPQHASSSTIVLHLSFGDHLRWVPMLIGLRGVHTPLLKSWFSLTWLTIIHLLTYYNKKIPAFIFFVVVFPVYFTVVNSWKRNPMYNTHPKLCHKILGKKVRIILEILRYLLMSATTTFSARNKITFYVAVKSMYSIFRDK